MNTLGCTTKIFWLYRLENYAYLPQNRNVRSQRQYKSAMTFQIEMQISDSLSARHNSDVTARATELI